MDIFARDKTFSQRINLTSAFMAAFHVGAIAALFFFTWKALVVAVVLWWVAGSLGIGMGYHRLLTHRGYKTPKLGRVLPDSVRHPRPRRRPDRVGRDAPHPSPEHRQRGRSTLAARRRSVGAHGLDHDRQGDAQLSGEFLPYVPDLRKDKFYVWISK